eukprot:TRINITY_DN4059_c1_g1_i1.p3 TRINITY_DN4059_c1_g1~~TRINITY_DN4059_c1_g1_i1.p3  ORF type:complete len:101 (+),score=40.01 TRINITY_DN4059_c1_g1_i1:70-372(+)
MFYRMIYQTVMYRNSHYMLFVAGLAFAYENINRSIAYNLFHSANDGKMQYQLRRSVKDAYEAEGEAATWNWGIHTVIPSPNNDNFQLRSGDPRYPAKDGQ